MTDHSIVPVEQRTVDFHGDDLVAVRDESGTVWVPIKRVCEALGVNDRGQLERIQRDPVLSEALRSARVTLADGRAYEMACLPLKYVRAWLFGINANRVKATIRDKLIEYQREVIEIIDAAFSGSVPAQVEVGALAALRDNHLQQAHVLDTIIRRLAPSEALLEEHDELLLNHELRLRAAERSVQELYSDLSTLRVEQGHLAARFTEVARLLPAPTDRIGPSQKAAIKGLVDDVVAAAATAGVRIGRGRNDYPAVWDAFKRRFDLAQYDELPLSQYEEALGWLKAWRDRVGVRG